MISVMTRENQFKRERRKAKYIKFSFLRDYMDDDNNFWEMPCVKISVEKQLDDLTYAQMLRDEERNDNRET